MSASITELTVNSDNIKFTAYAKKDGTFDCPCPRHLGKSNFNLEDISAHFKTWEKSLENYNPIRVEPVQWLSNDLRDTESLRKIDYAVNIHNNLLICTSCKVVVAPGSVFSHISDSHKSLKKSYDKPVISSILKDFVILTDIPPPPEMTIHAIEGLPIIPGFPCPECPSFFETEKYAKEHYNHHGSIMRYKAPGTVTCQRYNAYYKQLFPVMPPCEAVSPESLNASKIVNKLLIDMKKEEKPSIAKDDVRNVTPWLRMTKWHKFIDGYSPDKLVSLVALPSPAEFPSLRDAVEHFFDLAAELLPETSPLVLRKLHSPDPTKKGINNTPFHRHQEHERTMAIYMTSVVRLLAMLLRPQEHFKVILPGDIIEAVQNLRTGFRGSSIDDTALLVYEVLYLLWTREWHPSKDNNIPDPTMQYLALSTLREDGGFLEPKLVTNPIARFEYCMRLLYLFAMHKTDNVPEACDILARWFTEGRESTFNSLREHQHFASSLALSTQFLPKIWWVDPPNFRFLRFRGYPIHLDWFPSMFSNMDATMRKIWEEEVLCGLSLRVNYDEVFDDLANDSVGYSFYTDERNKFFQERTQLPIAILENPHLYNRFVSFRHGDDIHWNLAALSQWLASYARLQELQVTRVNMTAGSASRMTELTALTRCNTETNPMRNLVMMNKHLVLLTTYQKSSALTGTDKCIPHALDSFSADLMIQDLALARPFAEIAAYLCYPKANDVVHLYRKHVFVNQNRLFTTPDITLRLETVTNDGLKVKLGTNPWRHVTTAFRRKQCTRTEDLIEQDDMDSVQAAQMGHSRWTENRIYALSSDSLTGLPEDLLPLFLEASTDWQIICGVVPGGLGIPYFASQADAFQTLLKSGKIVRPRMAAGPSSSTHLDAITSLQSSQGLIRTSLAQQQETLISIQSQLQFQTSLIQSLKIQNLIGESQTPSEAMSPTVKADSSLSEFSLSDSVTDSLEEQALQILRKLCGNAGAYWTSPEQLRGVLALLDLQQDVIAILPTGSGKTMLFIIPALMEDDRVTIVVLPLQSLMIDYTRKLTAMGVPFELFNGSRIVGKANLILVSADTASADLWRERITELDQRKKVVRQVFDEAHIPLGAADYRPRLARLYKFRIMAIQMVLLSATITFTGERILSEQFCLQQNFISLRTPTNRPELEYVWKRKTKTYLEEIRALIKSYDSPTSSRYLIFVPFMTLGKQIAEEFSLNLYNGSQETTDDERLNMYKNWISGLSKGMVCTQAFGAGNDYSQVRLVIHVDTPFEMVNYVQEISRGGRDKHPAQCILFATQRSRPELMSGDLDLTGKHAMWTAVHDTSSCIRFTITSFIDAEGTYCKDSPNNQTCSYCKEHSVSIKRKLEDAFGQEAEMADKKRRDDDSLELNYITDFKRALIHFSKKCVYCAINNVRTSYHDILRCQTLEKTDNNRGIKTYRSWRAKIRYGVHHQGICYRCHVPQGENDALHETFDSDGKSCGFPDMIAPIAYFIYLDPEQRIESGAAFGQTFDNLHNFTSWLNGPIVPGHRSNISALFLWYSKRALQTPSAE